MRSLNYHVPQRPVVTLRYLWISRALVLFSAGVALLILLGAWLTGSVLFAAIGFVWLLVGGTMTLAAFTLAFGDLITAAHARIARAQLVQQAMVSMMLVVLNLALAVACYFAGIKCIAMGSD